MLMDESMKDILWTIGVNPNVKWSEIVKSKTDGPFGMWLIKNEDKCIKDTFGYYCLGLDV
jgi:hypothetical protein